MPYTVLTELEFEFKSRLVKEVDVDYAQQVIDLLNEQGGVVRECFEYLDETLGAHDILGLTPKEFVHDLLVCMGEIEADSNAVMLSAQQKRFCN